MIRGTAQIRKNTLIPSPIDLSVLFSQHKELQKLFEDTTNAHDTFLSEVQKKLTKIDELIASVKIPSKGDKGDMPMAGVHYPIPRNGVNGKDGETPVIDYKKIASIASQLIEKPKDGKNADEERILKKLTESLLTGKTKLTIKHIDGFNEGLEQTIAPIRHLAAGFRGGGDTVVAGSGITITTNTNGNKIITAGASANTVVGEDVSSQAPGTSFTLAHTPSSGSLKLYRGGSRQNVGASNDYTISGAVITFNVSVSAGEIIIADYTYA